MSVSEASARQALSEELRDLSEQIENIKEDVSELSAQLDDAQFNWQPEPGRWSISECLAHLNLGDGLDLPLLAEEIEGARQAGITGTGPFRYGLLSRVLVRYSEPPVKFKGKCPKIYLPQSGQPKAKVVDEFMSIHDRLLDLMAQSNGLDLARIKVPTPIGLFKFSLGQRFALLTAHDRRHLRQAWEVRKSRDFPV